MELFFDIIGYSIIFTVLGAISYAFVVCLSKALQALTNNDD